MSNLAVKNIDDVMILRQLPEIEQKLSTVKTAVEMRLNQVSGLVASEAALKELKSTRAQIRKEFEQFESGRKHIKQQILEPYKNFETVYDDCIATAYNEADSQLKERINTVESEIKMEKQKEAEQYFNEYAASLGIEFVSFERLGLKINLSSSMKSLKTGIQAFLDGVQADLQMIHLQPDKEEILVEYRRCLNVSEAVKTVVLRRQAVEEEKARQEKQFPAPALTPPETEPIEILQAPTLLEPEESAYIAQEQPAPAEENTDPVLELTFTVRASKSKLKKLKAFLTEGGYEVE